MKSIFRADMIAPCGINCTVCYAHMRQKSTCGGCRSNDNLSNACQRCIIRNCDKREGGATDFCYVCDSYPCAKLKALDKRYRTKYATDIRDIQETIRRQGMEALLEKQRAQWTCPTCGGLICMHRGACDICAQNEK